MKAKELMIGDWVSVLARFLETSTEGTATSGYYNLCRKNCHIGGMNGDLIAIDKICSDVIAYEPIPLTEDILKANGWKGTALYWSKHKVPFEISILVCRTTPFINGHGSVCYYIKYVHELQHALHLSGLNDLADNFKVK